MMDFNASKCKVLNIIIIIIIKTLFKEGKDLVSKS